MAVNPGKNSVPAIRNVGLAPILFFDAAPVFGHANGIIELTLTARVLGQRDNSSVQTDINAVAHLRCSAAAAQNLCDALDRALDLLKAAAVKPVDKEELQ